ncbi:MAG: GNAT family N-acetyltransferase [Dysgonamonadaceae bacterium]|nr:GNAT family N-acetyltransferase [Dysgonamonadaceae bacterium]MDD4727424.1 GNAT family N-acetyltransferase [Dysgonamonadaceae bacterium]
MISYITPETKDQIMKMWKVCFGDSQPYFDIYFREKYRNENTLAYFEGEKVVASLQLLHYNFTYCDTEIPIAYISGACTLPEARKKGYMAELLMRTFHELVRKDIPVSLLVPEEDWLLGFYNKYGYAQTFDKGQDLLSLRNLLEKHPDNLRAAYAEFNTLFRDQEMTVQKTFDDFRVVIEEAAGYDYPPKKSLTGMARVIDARMLLELFAMKHPDKSFSLEVTDPILSQNNLFIAINEGKVSDTKSEFTIHLHLTIYDLAQALLGYHTSQNQTLFKDVFPEHQPQMHFMME